MKKTALSVLVLTLSALYSIVPLLMRPEFTFGEDLTYHINWAHQVSAGMKEGILYPRWLSESNGGYGSPTTIFYAPLYYLFTGVINLFVPSLTVSLKVTTFIGFLLSGISMYLFLRNFCNHAGSVTGGMAYQLLPYHMFDLYWRGTLAETFAFAWMPLILHFAYKGVTDVRLLYWIGMSLSYAGLILTHIATAYIFTFVIVVFVISLSLRGKDYRVLLRFVLSFVFGFSLSAIYFIPMVFERKFVHIEWLTEVGWGDYRHNFLFLPENNLNIFHIHLEQFVMLQVLLVFPSLILFYYKSRRYGKLPNPYQFLFFCLLFVFSIFILTPLSMPIWKIIPGLPTIQFPWRWISLSTLGTAVLIGLTFDLISFEEIKRDRFIRIFMAVFQALLICNLYLSSIYILTADTMQKKDLEWILRDGGDVIEYRPIWLTEKKKYFPKESWVPVIFKEGTGNIEIVNWKSHSRLFKMNTSIPAMLRVSIFYYPGWTALVNGREIPIEIEKDSGAMLLNIPPGKNNILLEFRDTPLRKMAKWISIVSLIAALLGLVMVGLKGRRKAIFTAHTSVSNGLRLS